MAFAQYDAVRRPAWWPMSGAPRRQWMESPLRNSWLFDPLALDSAFQMASLWC